MSQTIAEDMTFFVGDSDLRFLGAVAALTARYQALRKGGIVRGFESFPQSDKDAVALLLEGVELGAMIPLDDVPEFPIGIRADKAILLRVRDYVREIEDQQHDDEYDDDEEWKEGK